MTPMQQTAFDHPTYLGLETLNPRFTHRHVHRIGGMIRMTVNAGYE